MENPKFDVSISGIQNEDPYKKLYIEKEVMNTLEKMSKMITVDNFSLIVKKSNEEGRRSLFTMNAKLNSNVGSFTAKEEDWDIRKSTNSILNKLEREILKHLGKT